MLASHTALAPPVSGNGRLIQPALYYLFQTRAFSHTLLRDACFWRWPPRAEPPVSDDSRLLQPVLRYLFQALAVIYALRCLWPGITVSRPALLSQTVVRAGIAIGPPSRRVSINVEIVSIKS